MQGVLLRMLVLPAYCVIFFPGLAAQGGTIERGTAEPLDYTGLGVRLLQETLIAKCRSTRLYIQERIDGLTRLSWRRSEVCLGVTPIEGFGAIDRKSVV